MSIQLNNMQTGKNTHGFIRISIALLITIAAVLWLCNHKTKILYSKDHLPVTPSLRDFQDNKPVLDSIQAKSMEQNIPHDGIQDERSFGSRNLPTPENPEDSREVRIESSGYARTMTDLMNLISALQSDDSFEIEKAIRHLWVVAADLGVPDEALDALEHIIMEQDDKDLIELAKLALTDLSQLLDIRQGLSRKMTTSSNSKTEEHHANQNHIRSVGMHNRPEFSLAENKPASVSIQEQMVDLKERALFDPDTKYRKDAIQALSFYRSDAAVDILMKAADDPEPTNRYLSSQALWIMAADGVGDEELIKHCLLQLQGDTDKQVAELASRAITDLDRLEIDSLTDED